MQTPLAILVLVELLHCYRMFNFTACCKEYCSGRIKGASGATAPLHDENAAWRPLFCEKSTPCLDHKALFLNYFPLNLERPLCRLPLLQFRARFPFCSTGNIPTLFISVYLSKVSSCAGVHVLFLFPPLLKIVSYSRVPNNRPPAY